MPEGLKKIKVSLRKHNHSLVNWVQTPETMNQRCSPHFADYSWKRSWARKQGICRVNRNTYAEHWVLRFQQFDLLRQGGLKLSSISNQSLVRILGKSLKFRKSRTFDVSANSPTYR